MGLLKRAIVVIALWSLTGVLVVGCGTKGPLYIPGVPATAQWPYPTPTPAPQKPEPKPADVPSTSDEKK